MPDSNKVIFKLYIITTYIILYVCHKCSNWFSCCRMWASVYLLQSRSTTLVAAVTITVSPLWLPLLQSRSHHFGCRCYNHGLSTLVTAVTITVSPLWLPLLQLRSVHFGCRCYNHGFPTLVAAVTITVSPLWLPLLLARSLHFNCRCYNHSLPLLLSVTRVTCQYITSILRLYHTCYKRYPHEQFK